MQLHSKVTAAFLCVLTSACGVQQKGSGVASLDSDLADTSVAALAASIGRGLTAANPLKDAQALSYATFQKEAGAELRPGRIVVEGVVFEATTDSVDKVRTQWASIDSRYSNVKEYWNAIGFDPQSLNQQSFTVALKNLRNSRSSASPATATLNLTEAAGTASKACTVGTLGTSCIGKYNKASAYYTPKPEPVQNHDQALLDAAIRSVVTGKALDADEKAAVAALHVVQGADTPAADAGTGNDQVKH